MVRNSIMPVNGPFDLVVMALANIGIFDLRRLWAVRRLLLAGNKPLQIKACALSNGFWHMGKFAALYAAQFGEAPSMTLARARWQLR